MTQFVDECRKEWQRLGVPEAVSNEMAGDLAADLAEAEAEGVSPEEVLGNGVFDARSFAASWAIARGVVSSNPQTARSVRRPPWTAALSALVSLIVGGAGLAILVVRQGASVAIARSVDLPFFPPRQWRIRGQHVVAGPFRPPMIFGPTFLGGNAPDPLGWVLLGVGVIGLGLTLWLWRPWSTERSRPVFDENVGLPSYL
jgi:hypothetical protein